MVLRLELIPGDILCIILMDLSLTTLSNLIRIMTDDAQKVAIHVFKTKVLMEILYGTSNFSIMARPTPHQNAGIHYVQLVVATQNQTGGSIIIHYTPTAFTGPANMPFHLDLISEISLDINQPQPQIPQGFNISFMSDSDKRSNPKRYMAWEIVSTRGQLNVYKFNLKTQIGAVPWKLYFANSIDVFVKTRIAGGLYHVEDVWFRFVDLFFICRRCVLNTNNRVSHQGIGVSQLFSFMPI